MEVQLYVCTISCASLVITPLPFPSRSDAGAKPHFLGLVFKNYLYVVLSPRSPYFPCIVVCSQTDLLFHSVCHLQVLSRCLCLYFVPVMPSCFHPHPFPSFLLAASVPLNCRFHCLEHSVPPQVDKSIPSFTVWFKRHLHRKAFHNPSC